MCRATSKATIVTDSNAVRRKVQRISDVRKPWGKHQEAWANVWQHRRKVHAVHWVRANLGEHEVEARAHTGGYPSQWQTLNKGAEELAGIGIPQHDEDPGNDALRRRRGRQVIMYWRYLFEVHKLVRSRQHVKGAV